MLAFAPNADPPVALGGQEAGVADVGVTPAQAVLQDTGPGDTRYLALVGSSAHVAVRRGSRLDADHVAGHLDLAVRRAHELAHEIADVPG